ncbi:hypothetical protein QCM80_16765 [Bradyrhizobium sp. SSUT112]|uniref:hypothetical protein n=1 Tax=Bradyrhizobium sp. SSUT112 TaxID=3040604 RepID=UPI002449D9D6|nr:hypothetical protein [Bradyrhizobium sp. SSUT112]MDH2352290.1 hypothetical protein [Bradyrhizobium sp. SSUT112]
MIMAWIGQVRAVAFALAGGLGAITLGWAVSANTETPASPLLPGSSAAVFPQMPSRNLTSNFEAIVERPLFLQTRRPTPPKRPAAEPQAQTSPIPPPPPLAATLLGIIISPDVKSAVIRLSSGKSVTVIEGGSIDGWELKRIEPDLAQFRYRDANLELSFPIHQSSPSQVARTAPPGALVRRRQ